MPASPEELLRSIERTREELAMTVDTIAGRLDPKRAAKRGIGKVKSGFTGAFDGAREKLRLGSTSEVTGFAEPSSDAGISSDGHGHESAATKAKRVAKTAAENAKPALRRVPKPVIGGGLAALIALAAVIALRRRRR
jgi:MYXO-CTERM domain-containing protein